MKQKRKFYYIFSPGFILFLIGLVYVGCLVWPAMAAFLGMSASGLLMANVAAGFTEEQQTELQKLFREAGEKHKSTIKVEIDAALNKVMTTEQLAEKLKALGLEEKVIDKINDAIEKQGLALQEFIKGEEDKSQSLESILVSKKDEIKKLASGEARSFKIELPKNVVKTLVQRAAVNNSTQAMRLPEIGQLGYLGAVMTNLFRHSPVSPDSNGIIRYMDQSLATRNADNKAEGAAAPESAIEWTERTIALEKIMDSIPVSHEAFRDVLFVQSEIERLLQVNLALKEDQQIYKGSGVAPQIKGVHTSAGAFAAGALAGTVDSANVYDLIAAIRVTIMNNNQSKYAPDFVVMNPLDIFKYKVLKGADGHYLLPPFVGPNGQVIDSIRVIESSQVTANELVLGDSKYGTIYDLEGVTIEMGFVDDQFTKDTMTLKAKKRMALLIRTVDETGFKKVADITAAIATLETP